MINKEEIKKIILKKMKENPDYLDEQAQAYDEEYALQQTFSIEFFPSAKIDAAKEVRDYLFELKEEFQSQDKGVKDD